MNAIELLKKDHRTVESLFESFEKAKEKEEETSKSELFASIKEELDTHARVEEEIFYPAFDQGAEKEDDKELVLEAGEEHKQVKTLLAELAELDPDDESFDAKMKVLKDNVEHHVKEEEGEMFPHAQKQLGGDRLEELGQQIAARKEQIQQQGVGETASRSAGRSAAAPASARAAAPRRRSGRTSGRGSAGAEVARASGSTQSELLESMEGSSRSSRSGVRSSSSRSSNRGGSSSSRRSSGGSSGGRTSSTRSSSGGRSSGSRGGSSRGRSRTSATRGRSASSRRGRSSSSSRGGSSGRRSSSGRRGSSSSSRSRSSRSR